MKQSFWQNIRGYFRTDKETIHPVQHQKLRLSGKGLSIPIQGYPVYQIEMGKQFLSLYPDPDLAADATGAAYDFILFDPQRYFSGIAHFLRLAPGNTLELDRNLEYQEYVFSSPREVFRRHFSITHEGDTLVFRDPISELGTYISLVEDSRECPRITTRRRTALMRVSEIYGEILTPLPSDKAITTLTKVNELLRNETCRRKDSYGNPGGIVELPKQLTPIIVGDLHARVDNLLMILSENAFLECLENGTAALIILGDAVHPEEGDKLGMMDSSLLMMDLILSLKLQFPEQVFYIAGNHDSFSYEIMKQGVPQGMLWEKKVIAARGDEYKAELELFYQQSPLAVLSPDFIACHAGPSRDKISLEMLVNVRQFPEIVHDMTWRRLKTPGFPAGYTRGDVRRFRKGLEAESDIPFIVGHHPCTEDGTLWLDAGHIQQHHIVISSRPDHIGMFTRIDDRIVPQIYPTEPLTAWLNTQLTAG